MIDEMHLERAVVFAAETDAVMRVVLELDDADAIAAFPSLSFDADHFADLDENEEDEVHGLAHAFLTLLDEQVEPVATPVPHHLARYSADALAVIHPALGARLEKPATRSRPRGEAVQPRQGTNDHPELHPPTAENASIIVSGDAQKVALLIETAKHFGLHVEAAHANDASSEAA